MPKNIESEISESSEEVDELDYGSDVNEGDEMNVESEEEDELLSSEAEEVASSSRQSIGSRAASKASKLSKSSKLGSAKKAKSKPKGKLIHFDSVNIPKGDGENIDKFISTRVNSDDSEDILVKYKNMSYLHCKWVSLKELDEDKKLRVRARRFLDKFTWDTQWSDDEPFNPSYLKIDRIIDDGELDGELHYLVKWCSQAYDQSTWESQKTVEALDPEKIDDFEYYRLPTAERRASYAVKGRRPIGKWRKLTVSPKFKDDNTLRSYQLEGLNWLMFCWHNKQNSILADEMGLGKTVQSTAFLYELYRNQKIQGPFLVIVPLSTMGNWEREMKNWTEMNVIVYHGNQASRNLIVETEYYFRDKNHDLEPGIFKFDVILTTYEMAMSGAAQLRPVPWKCVILDEAHRLKNKNSKVTEFLRSYQMEHRVLLTGTPLQNSLDELWALLNFLEPERFSSDKDFQLEYGNMSSAADVEKLQLLLKPLMLRRLKEDVEKSIPVKEETIVEVELTTTQKKWYRSILERNFSWLKQGSKKNNVPNLVNTMIELRKCCIHPWLLNGAEDQILMELNAENDNALHAKALIQSSGKMVLLDKLLTKLKAGGHKVLIFSQMTRCLDLIQEYVRAKGWNFERIDGGVRGELRQASIDRFSSPGGDSFLFLLCTRAGGVGINLTAADTCIIFDSDWNPQNDLQAQSRIHRIGQKKAVKIYRLITRNTYEREMFDRASMKLGLDKALLQRGGDSDPFDSNGKSGNLSKQEVEDLLKKGAYGAFMDDGAGDKFCEEDIEQILERRTMVIRHDEDSASKKGSMFSKASFQATGSTNTIDVNDPEFWDKVAEQAQLEVVDELPEDSLILHGTRERKQIAQYGADGVDQDPSEDYRGYKPVDAKQWTNTERNRMERAVMQFGFHQFEAIALMFPRRTVVDIKACIRDLLMKCMELAPNTDQETVDEVKRAIGIFYPPADEEGSDGGYDEERNGTFAENPYIVDIHEDDLPHTGADEKEQYEFLSCIREAPSDYLEHLAKKAKNLLIRVALLYNIRERTKPSHDMHMPRLVGNTPAPWWGPEQDRDLLIGICRHGYQQYTKIWNDPDLSFYKIIPKVDQSVKIETDTEKVKAEGSENEDDVEMEDEGNMEQVEDIEIDPSLSVQPSGVSTAAPSIDPVSGALVYSATVKSDGPVYVPTPTELGLRIRKVLAGLARQRQAELRGSSIFAKIRKDKFIDKRRGKEQDMSKKSKQDFQRTLLAFGVKRDPSGNYDWAQFKEIAELTRKTDEALTKYCDSLIELSKRTVEYHAQTPGKGSAQEIPIINNDFTNPLYPVGEEGETLTIDRAKKVLRRIEYFDKLRLKILKMDDLAERLGNTDLHGKATLPKWWKYEYDIPFLTAVDRYGYSRGECFVDADDLPFKELYVEYLKSLEVRKQMNLLPTQIVDGIWEEKFWMRDSVALKRFELLVGVAEQPSKAPRKAGRPKGSKEENSKPIDASNLKTLNPATASGYIPAKYQQSFQNDSGGDTDEMLKAAADTINKSKKKRHKKLTGPEEMLPRQDDQSSDQQVGELRNRYPDYSEAYPPPDHMYYEYHPEQHYAGYHPYDQNSGYTPGYDHYHQDYHQDYQSYHKYEGVEPEQPQLAPIHSNDSLPSIISQSGTEAKSMKRSSTADEFLGAIKKLKDQ